MLWALTRCWLLEEGPLCGFWKVKALEQTIPALKFFFFKFSHAKVWILPWNYFISPCLTFILCKSGTHLHWHLTFCIRNLSFFGSTTFLPKQIGAMFRDGVSTVRQGTGCLQVQVKTAYSVSSIRRQAFSHFINQGASYIWWCLIIHAEKLYCMKKAQGKYS